MAVDILELAQTAPPEIRQKFQQREYSEGDCIISPAAMPTCCPACLRCKRNPAAATLLW